MITCNKTLHYLTKFMNNDVTISMRQNKATKLAKNMLQNWMLWGYTTMS